MYDTKSRQDLAAITPFQVLKSRGHHGIENRWIVTDEQLAINDDQRTIYLTGQCLQLFPCMRIISYVQILPLHAFLLQI